MEKISVSVAALKNTKILKVSPSLITINRLHQDNRHHPLPTMPPLTVILRRRRAVRRIRPQMVTRIRILVHRRKGVSAQRAPRTREPPVMGPRGSPMRIPRPRIEMVLVRRPQRPVPMLLQLYEGALRDRRRVRGLMRCRRSDVRLPWHRGGAGWVLVRPPKWGTQIREVQRREGFVIHFERVRRRGGCCLGRRGVVFTSTYQPRT